MEMSAEPHAPAASPPRKEPWYPLNKKLGGFQSWSTCKKRKISCPYQD